MLVELEALGDRVGLGVGDLDVGDLPAGEGGLHVRAGGAALVVLAHQCGGGRMATPMPHDTIASWVAMVFA